MDVLRKLLPVLLLASGVANCDKQEATPAGSQFIKSGNEGCDQQQIPGEYLVYWQSGKVTVEAATDEDAFLNQFMSDHKDEILKAEPHYRIQAEEKIVGRGWGGEINWGVYSTEADWAWGKSQLGSDITVAVIDSGFDRSHPELEGVVAINEQEEINGIDDDGNGYVDDRYGYDFVGDTHEVSDYTGHGTHVAGVIAARHDVGQILGVAPGVKILPLNFINRNGGGQIIDALNAIRYAASRKVKVINASWGGEACSSLLRDEIQALIPQNILFVVAAGNSGNDISRLPEYPAAFLIDNIITVGASTFDNKTAQFSNYGVLVDLVAPGANIASTYPEGFDYDGLRDGVATLDGTSMAAPYVSAAAAVLWAQKPDASYEEIKAALVSGVIKGPYPVQSQGALNIPRAMGLLGP